MAFRLDGFPDSDGTLENIPKVHEDVPAMLKRLLFLYRKNNLLELTEKARKILAL